MKSLIFDWKKTPLNARFLIEASAGTGKTFSLIRFIVRLLMEGENPIKINEILVVTFTVAATAELKKRLKELLLIIREARETQNMQLLIDSDLEETYQTWSACGWLKDARLDNAIAGLSDAQVFTIHGFCQAILTENEFSGARGFDFEIGDDNEIRQQCVNDFLSDCTDSISDEKLKKQLAIAEARWDQKLDRINAQSRLGNVKKQIRFLEYEKIKGSNDKETIVALNGDLLEKLNEFIVKVPTDLNNRKKSKRLYTFTDLLTCVQEGLKNSDFVRSVRSRYKAVLIDEFQDTDPVQYSIFKTLFLPDKDADDYPATVVFVGDPKQSIYLFRDADIKTYEKARADLGDIRFLHKNYRSTPVLLCALNTFFQMQNGNARQRKYFRYENVTGAKGKLPLLRKRADGLFKVVPVFSIWTDNNDKHLIENIRKVEAQNIVADICSLLDGSVLKANDEPLKPSDIAILVRRYKDADTILPLLRSHGIEYQLDSDEDVFATEEAREILDILKAMQAPDDIKCVNWARATRIFHESINTIAYERVVPLNGQQPVNKINSDVARSKARTALISAADTFSTYGVSAAFSSLFIDYHTEEKILAEPNGEQRLTNYRHILELLQQVNSEKKSLAALSRWFAKQIADDSPQTSENRKVRLCGGADRVSVMSIHKSKGLEFPVVYLAGAFNKPESNQKAVTFRQTDDEGRTTLWLSHKPITASTADEILEKMGFPGTFVDDEVTENARIAYVAMTRASQRLVLPLLVGGKGASSRLNNAYFRLMRGGEIGKKASHDDKHLIDEFKENFTKNLSVAVEKVEKLPQVLKTIETLTQKNRVSTNFIEVKEIDEIEDFPSMQREPVDISRLKTAEAFKVNSTWARNSFTSITRNTHTDDFIKEKDENYDEELDLLTNEPTTETGLINAYFNVKKAATFGDLIHQMFEKADFEKASVATMGNQEALLSFKKLVEDRLKSYEEWTELKDTLTVTLLNTLTRPIHLPDNQEFSLSDLKKDCRTTEMEFTIDVKAEVRSEDLKKLLDFFDKKYHLPKLQQLNLQGFLNGFIDLAFTHKGQFWVLDWKTNKRGIEHSKDVSTDWITSQMKEHFYTLQYLIYLVALKRYLALIGINKIPRGAIYVFVSAAVEKKPEGNDGLWIDQVPPSLIECLDDFFKNGYNEITIQQYARQAARGM